MKNEVFLCAIHYCSTVQCSFRTGAAVERNPTDWLRLRDREFV